MMNMLKKSSSRSKGQAMVEFALVFPILMVVVVGLIEAGRLLFIYGSGVTASRQAVRYGTATGFNDSGNRKYLDCDDIAAEAERMGILATVTNVDIKYYDGETDSQIHDCASGNPTADIFKNGDRIEVTTTTRYEPMLSFVPGFSGFDIVSSSRRSIFTGIIIESTPDDPTITPALTLHAPTFSTATYSSADESIDFKFVVENTGPVALTLSAVSVTIVRASDAAKIGTVSCDTGALAVGATKQCSGTYLTTGTDDADYASDLTFIGSANGTDGTYSATAGSNGDVEFSSSTTVTLDEVSVDPAVKSSGDVTFTYKITNSGSTPLSTFSISDTGGLTLHNISCSGELAVGASKTCTAKYTIRDPEDLDAGFVVHNARIEAEYNGVIAVATGKNATVYTKPLTISVRPIPSYSDVGSITYSFQLTNHADVALNNLTITLGLERLDGTPAVPSSVTIDCGATIGANASITCNGPAYAIEQEDLNAGGIALINITATADDALPATTDDTNIPADPEAHLKLTLVDFKADGVSISDEAAGDENNYIYTAEEPSELIYTYRIENTGNIDIPSGVTIGITGGPSNCSVPALTTPLVRGGTIDCQTSYAVDIPDDWDAGSIISPTITATSSTFNWGKGTLTFATQTPISNTVNTVDGPRLEISSMSAQIIFADGSPSVTVQSGNAPAQALVTGDQIIFSYKLKNTGSLPLTQNFSITDTAGTISCNAVISTLAQGAESQPCNRDGGNIYTVTGSELSIFNFSASASANSTAGTVNSDSPDPTVYFTVTSSTSACTGYPWRSDAYYNSGYVVNHGGYDWTASSSQMGNEPGTANWAWPDANKVECLGYGPPPPSCTYAGWEQKNWGHRYRSGDRVTYDFAQWLATSDNTAIPAGNSWAWTYEGDCTTTCQAAEWDSATWYINPNVVYYCSDGTCAEWVAQQGYSARNNTPGDIPPGGLVFWKQRNYCEAP